jgi:ParB-like chromosome segregation protein Spo0J
MTQTPDSAELLADEGGQAFSLLQAAEAPSGPEVVPIESLLPADSPRILGVDAGHTRALQENLHDLPAILVNRRTMQVIDGMHRLSATRLAGAETIRAEFIDTDERNAFLLAVKANIQHGLPLSVTDREAAAERILSWYPYWSDRAIAAIAGLAATTVGAIRERSTVQLPQLNARIGRDGRLRPMSTLDGRRRASEIIAARPDASLREIAREAGISLGTAHNVRERMRRGEDCVPDNQGAKPERSGSQGDGRTTRRRRRCAEPLTWQTVRERLLKDPALRYSEAGRVLLRWFDSRAIGTGDWRAVIDTIPPHWIETMINVANSCGNEWHELAAALEQRNTAVAG